MKFSIDSIILWPKQEKFPYRRLPFANEKMNIITGASRTGKSAIIPIIDYCLCSSKCQIPVDVIRNSCEWFGVLFNLEDGQLLLCRREPGTQVSTGEMYMTRNDIVDIPQHIEANITADAVKNTLNELFSMSFLDMDPEGVSFSARPSYRDFMAFLFQPQNIIANADVLFYKTDATEHRQRLINIFPYVLGAVTPEVLAARQELDHLKKKRDRLQRDIDTIKDVSEMWKQEVFGWLSHAKELGLTQYVPAENSTFEEQVDQLGLIVNKSDKDISIQVEQIQEFSVELAHLRNEEQQISSQLFALQRRQNEMSMLKSSMSKYDHALQIQLQRLEISSWLRTVVDPNKMPPLSQSGDDSPAEVLDKLCSAIEAIEQSSGSMKTMPAAFERELASVETEIIQKTERLKAIQRIIQEKDNFYVKFSDQKYTRTAVSRFLGRLEASIETYKRLGKDEQLESQLSQINARIEKLSNKVNENELRKKQEAALRFISQKIGEIIPHLDTEHPDDPVDFIIKDLTVRIKNKTGREDYLWEIGSASNWLAYHVATILAFQYFFQNRATVLVPNFMIFDQPSQVYFPQLGLRQDTKDDKSLNIVSDEDKLAVRKVFEAMSKSLQSMEAKVQIIVAEHADEDVWGGIEGIHLVERWRDTDKKLVPTEWIRE